MVVRKAAVAVVPVAVPGGLVGRWYRKRTQGGGLAEELLSAGQRVEAVGCSAVQPAAAEEMAAKLQGV
jgi:hypothetical protein